MIGTSVKPSVKTFSGRGGLISQKGGGLVTACEPALNLSSFPATCTIYHFGHTTPHFSQPSSNTHNRKFANARQGPSCRRSLKYCVHFTNANGQPYHDWTRRIHEGLEGNDFRHPLVSMMRPLTGTSAPSSARPLQQQHVNPRPRLHQALCPYLLLKRASRYIPLLPVSIPLLSSELHANLEPPPEPRSLKAPDHTPTPPHHARRHCRR